MTVMNDTVVLPEVGEGKAGVQIRVVLLSPTESDEGLVTGSDLTIVDGAITTTDNAGAFSIDLHPTSAITPSGSRYRAIGRARQGNRTVYDQIFSVPDTGPAWIADHLDDAPTALTQTLNVDFLGPWQTAQDYVKSQGVSHNGASYVALSDHTSAAATEPGVGANWQDVWFLLAAKGETGDALANIGANDTHLIADSTTADGVAWVREGALNVMSPRFGAKGDGTTNDAPAIQAAIDAANTERRSVYIPTSVPVEYRLEAGLVVPKTPGLNIFGDGERQTRLLGAGLASTTPVIKWDDSVTGSVDFQGLYDMTIDRNNAGPVIDFTQNSGATGGLGDRWRGSMERIEARQTSGSTGTLIHINYGLFGSLRKIHVDGGDIGIHLDQGSNMSIEGLYVDQKVSGPNALLIEGGGEHLIIRPRSEGSRGGYSYKCLNTRENVFLAPRTEGDEEAAVYHIENSQSIVLIEPGVGLANNSTAAAPRGILIKNSNNTQILGGHVGGYDPAFPGVGKSLEIDSASRGTKIDGLAVEGTNPDAEILNNGVEGYLRVLREGSTPAYAATVYGDLLSKRFVTPVGVSEFGTLDNSEARIIQNGAIGLRVNSTDVVLDKRATTSHLKPSSDNVRDLGTDAARYRQQFTSGRTAVGRLKTFADGATTPSVSETSLGRTANTSATTITNFTNGVAGQVLFVIIGDANTTIDFTASNLKGNAGADWTPAQNDHMECVYDGTNWYCNISDNTV